MPTYNLIVDNDLTKNSVVVVSRVNGRAAFGDLVDTSEKQIKRGPKWKVKPPKPPKKKKVKG